MDSRARFETYKVLVIDDLAAMRSQIVSSLNLLGFKHVWSVNNCQQALAHIASIRFEIILCDYHLGDVTSGQQFLEHIRSHDLIPTSTLFVMVTAKRSYEDVMRVAECAPDDYLVKPFTGAQLDARISRLVEKRHRLNSIHSALANKNWPKAIALADQVIAARDRLALEAMKLKGIALLGAQNYTVAENLYRGVLATRSLGWARLGLAKVLKGKNQATEAEIEFTTLIAEGTKNAAADRMGAYDELIDLLQDSDRSKEALAIAQDAMTVSPGTLSRTRVVTRLAMDEGNYDLATSTVRKLVEDHRYSQVKLSTDYLMAADVLSTTGNADEALITISNVRKSFDEPADVQTLAIAEATVQFAKGNPELAEKLIQTIAPESVTKLSPTAAAAFGKSLYRLGDHEGATKIMRHLIQNNPDNVEIKRTVQAALSSVGLQAEGKALVESSMNEIAEINNEGVRLAYAGKLDEAIQLLTRAADAYQGNMQFVSNAALVIALALTKHGMDSTRLATCMRYREILNQKAPNHAKLNQIDNLLHELHGQDNDAASRRA
jgi:DNA-binding response OmpR family regulator